MIGEVVLKYCDRYSSIEVLTNFIHSAGNAGALFACSIPYPLVFTVQAMPGLYLRVVYHIQLYYYVLVQYLVSWRVNTGTL